MQANVLRFREARLAIERICDPLREQTVVLFVARKLVLLFQIGIYAVVDLPIVAPSVLLVSVRAVQLVQTDEKVFERKDGALIPPVPVCIVCVENELLVAIVIVVGDALSAFDDAPAHCVPFFHRVADGSIGALCNDLTGVVQVDVLVLRDETVKVF